MTWSRRSPIAPRVRRALTGDADVAGHDLPLDAHLHTDQSPDSAVPIDVYAALAVERGIPEIAITDHVDFDPRDPAYRYSASTIASAMVRGAAERWAKRGRHDPLRRRS